MKWYKKTEFAHLAAILAVVTMLKIPLPGILLDVFCLVGIATALITFFRTRRLRQISDSSSFLSILMALSVFRVALIAAILRQILTKGPAFEAQLIRLLGEFTVGNNYTIGVLVFLILAMIPVLFISKGVIRISEVTARFALDALPGRQMGLEAEFAAGRMTEEDLVRGNERLRRAVEFSGRIENSSRALHDEVRITRFLIPIIFALGVTTGIASRNEALVDALKTYALLTIGTGLVFQIQWLIIAAAIMVAIKRSRFADYLNYEL